MSDVKKNESLEAKGELDGRRWFLSGVAKVLTSIPLLGVLIGSMKTSHGAAQGQGEGGGRGSGGGRGRGRGGGGPDPSQ